LCVHDVSKRDARAAVSEPREADPHTRSLRDAALAELPLEDREDFEDARRGLIAAEQSLVLRDERGRVVWDMDAYRFLADDADAEGEAASGEGDEAGGNAERGGDDESAGGTGLADAPPTVHPSLWRMARLNSIHGLFEVAPRIYQVRGYDISNVTFVEGERGVIVIDPLISTECAAAALELYRRHRGAREVSAVIYSHSHVDHFGGVKGVVSEEAVRAGEVPVWAPVEFLRHAASENVLAGTAMARRASYMFAPRLPRGPRGQVDAGIGKSTSSGTITLIGPTHEVAATGQEELIDGVRFLFQLVPDSEAPAEMNFLLADMRALCIPENATHCLHNVLTPRGAPVRDALAWSKYLGEAIELFGERCELMFAQHHWPRWGRERVIAFLAQHRDLYRYLHDQTLRLANRGLTPTEIAAELTLPDRLARSWACRGYYGTVSHNTRAVYQRYLGFFDGNPAHLDPLTPVDAARRHVELAGGLDQLLAHARAALEQGEHRWAAELASHAVFAEPSCAEARALEAEALEQLGYQAESAVWRNIYLVGAHELREWTLGDAANGEGEGGDGGGGDVGETAASEATSGKPSGAVASGAVASGAVVSGAVVSGAGASGAGASGAGASGAGAAGSSRRRPGSADVARALTLEQLWDAIGARLDGPRAANTHIVLGWDFTDLGERWTLTVENGALSAVRGRLDPSAHTTVTLTRAAFDALLLGDENAAGIFSSGAFAVEGDGEKLGELFALLDEGDPAFPIVTP
jgi:linear primary-alkylsulfatase